MSLYPIRVARDALLGAFFFVVGAHAAAYAAPTGLQSKLSPTITAWEGFILFILGFVVLCLLIGAFLAVPTRGWGTAGTMVGAAVLLGFVTVFRDEIMP